VVVHTPPAGSPAAPLDRRARVERRVAAACAWLGGGIARACDAVGDARAWVTWKLRRR